MFFDIIRIRYSNSARTWVIRLSKTARKYFLGSQIGRFASSIRPFTFPKMGSIRMASLSSPSESSSSSKAKQYPSHRYLSDPIIIKEICASKRPKCCNFSFWSFKNDKSVHFLPLSGFWQWYFGGAFRNERYGRWNSRWNIGKLWD